MANNIWQEQQADAAPHPQEIAREQRRRLEDGECDQCGAEDNLDFKMVGHENDGRVLILCDECATEDRCTYCGEVTEDFEMVEVGGRDWEVCENCVEKVNYRFKR